MSNNIPVNKGNYSLDTVEREAAYEEKRAKGFPLEYRQNRQDWYQLPETLVVSDYPVHVDIELSSICNLKCPMCYTITEKFKEQVNARLMDFELYKKIIQEIGGKVFSIRLSLRGESTLHKQFLKAVRTAKENGIWEVSTLTNGSKLKDPVFCRDIVEAGLDWITVSIDGVGETYNRIRKPITYRQIIQNLKNLKHAKESLNSVKPVVKVQGIWPAMEKDPSTYYNAYAELSDLVAFNPLVDYMREIPRDILQYEENFICPMPYQRLVIGADGLAMQCANDEETDQPVGDVNTQSIHEIWHGDKMERVRHLQKTKDGFKKDSLCLRCYMPRITKDEIHQVNGRDFIVKNYMTSENFKTSIDDIGDK